MPDIFNLRLTITFPVLLILLFSWQGEVIAEIYKYKDENGQWKFTDKPPENSKTQGVATYSSHSKNSRGLANYQKQLSAKYKPSSPIESATLSVVTVQTSMGTGSGFFITDQCHLITNKHVVRPTSTKSHEESKEELEKEKEEIKRIKQVIADEEERLKIEKKNLAEYKNKIESLAPGRMRDKNEAEYRFYLKRYNKDVERLEEKRKKLRPKENEYNEKRYHFSVNSSLALLSKTFKVVLKDNTKTQASLVKLAKDDDLALLKISDCKSPYLTLKKSARPFQGMKIFAVGSPLGLKDHVTSGIVTNVTNDGINTDAQILPGNSGGPLITANGEVIGVNTLKVSAESSHSEGFGIAIPVAVVIENFGRYLQ